LTIHNFQPLSSRSCATPRFEYAAKGIPEYWIVDASKNRITILRLVDGFYEEAIFEGNDRIISGTFPDLDLTAEQVSIAKKL